ncbi:MAG: ATP-binding cassette domain-containing protein [Spirochaetaceae bacterium]|jgi:ABC-type lipoprotein export system ATPase subunit|nr:ATP-binding cassette domain-containing protein [Spirochaetaceae bacterium]
MEHIIELKEVFFSTQNQDIVRGVSYQFIEGKTTALVGPSGGGKSTVLKLAAGLLVPSGGTVYFRGGDMTLMNRGENLTFRRQSAMVFQDSALWANQSLYQNLELPLRIHFPSMTKADRENRMQEVLAEVGYKKNLLIRPAQLSMGEQKLIAFARAMLCGPHILFLDEWTESLDDRAAQHLIELVKRRKEQQDTIIFVSHDFRIIKNLADYMVMILGGQVSLALTGEEISSDDQLVRHIEKGITANEI